MLSAFVDELSPLFDGLFEILVESGGRATKREVMVVAALCDIFADEPAVVTNATAVRMFFASIDKEAHEKDVFDVNDALGFAKRIVEVSVHALKGATSVLLSFEVCFTGFLSEQIEEFFKSLDVDAKGALSIGELLEPMRMAREHAAQKHEQLLVRDASEITRAGQIYSGLLGYLDDISCEYSAYEAEAELFDLAMAPTNDPRSWTTAQMWYKIGLLKDALLGRLAIQAIKNGSSSPQGEQYVSRMEFLAIATTTATPLIREAFRVRHNAGVAAAEDAENPRVLFAIRLKGAMDRHLASRGLEPLLAAVFDLLDADSSGVLTLEVG